MHEVYTKICSVLFVCRTQAKKKIFSNEKNENKNKKYIYIVEKQRKKNDNSTVLLHLPKEIK
jgi:hypothetical protein